MNMMRVQRHIDAKIDNANVLHWELNFHDSVVLTHLLFDGLTELEF